MHPEPLRWVRAAFAGYTDRVSRVLELGAQNINGSPRTEAPSSVTRWVGVDVFDRPGVDWVGLAHRYPVEGWDNEPFDALVSCECFEHDPYWQASLVRCAALVRPGGLIVLTCATGERPPHGQQKETPVPGYYANIAPDAMRSALARCAVVEPPVVRVDRGNLDLYVLAMRAEPIACAAALDPNAGFDRREPDLLREWRMAVRRCVAAHLAPFDTDPAG